MTAAGVRWTSHPCSALIAACLVLAATTPSTFSFQVAVTVPSSSSSSSGHSSSCSSERGASRPHTLGQAHHQAQQRASAGIVLCEEVVRRSRPRGLVLLSEREDSADGGVQEQRQVSGVSGVPILLFFSYCCSSTSRRQHSSGDTVSTQAVHGLYRKGSRSEFVSC